MVDYPQPPQPENNAEWYLNDMGRKLHYIRKNQGEQTTSLGNVLGGKLDRICVLLEALAKAQGVGVPKAPTSNPFASAGPPRPPIRTQLDMGDYSDEPDEQ